jgi:hypothetical protein
MRVRIVLSLVLLTMVVAGGAGLAQAQRRGAPESFTANMQAAGESGGAAAATIQIDIRRYTPDADRTGVLEALKTGGYPGFLAALRKAPEVGSVSFGDRKWAIRWAREQPGKSKYSRSIVVVTDQPIFFVGGGRVDAKPREGYEVAVISLDIDDAGLGNGMMTAAARVKPGGESGVQIDDYADKPIKLITVTRNFK